MNFYSSAHVSSFDRTANQAGADWDFLKRLRDRWPHKLIIKGVQSPDDARRIAKMGVDAIYVSNHGGRQLNAAPAVIPHCHKFAARLVMTWCLSLTAGRGAARILQKPVSPEPAFFMVGRPFLYGLGAAGEKGIQRITDILTEKADITRGMIGETELTTIGLQNLAM